MLKNKTIHLIAISVVLLLFIVIYSFVLFNYPHQAGGDTLFHSWISEQIISTGSIPQTMPTNDSLGLYSLTPIFHIATSGFAVITGISISNALTILNIVLVLLFVLLLYSIAKMLLKNTVTALLSVGIVFTISLKFYFLYFLPRNLSIIFFLLAIYIILKLLSESEKSISKYVLLSLLCGSLLFTHLLNAAYSITIIGTIGIVLYLFTKNKRIGRALIITVIASSIIFGLINASYLLNQSFPIDSSDPSFVVKSSVASGSIAIPSLTSYIPLTLLVIFLIGLFSTIKTLNISNNRSKYYLVFAWLIASFLILYQIAGGYDYLASRALTLLIPIFSILLSWGLYIIVKYLLKINRGFTVIIPILLLLLIIYPLATQSLSSDSQQIKYGLTNDHIRELETIKNSLPSGTVLSDPTTMYLLTTLGGMSPAYTFEHTNLTRRRFIEWENVKYQFMSTPDEALKVIDELQPDYIVISADTKKLFPDADYSIYNMEAFTLMYESETSDQAVPASSVPHYYVFYSVD